jgi:predicted  nucleic acid-binding Zn-ribbon protein
MPTQHTTYSGILGALRRLRDALNANSDNLDYLDGGRAKLDRLLHDLEEAVSQQASLVAAKQETSKRVKELIRQGQRLAAVLRAALKEHYGIRAEKLAEFGLQPFRGRARKAPAAEEPEVTGEVPKPAGSTDSEP